MTNEELLEIIRLQDIRISALEENLSALRKWSDINDRYLQECVDALTESVDNGFAKIDKVMQNCEHYKHHME